MHQRETDNIWTSVGSILIRKTVFVFKLKKKKILEWHIKKGLIHNDVWLTQLSRISNSVTDGPTDRPTDEPTDRLVESRARE